MTDSINNPDHYTAGGIETIDVIEQVLQKLDHRDQVEKYNQRAHIKGTFKQDLEKARWYLNRTIENCEKGFLDPITGERVAPTAPKFDTATVYKDEVGDYWVFNDSTQEWRWFKLNSDLSEVRYQGGTFTEEELENGFSTRFLNPVAPMRTERLVREAVEKYDHPIPEGIVLGETDPADMPVGTVAYRDGILEPYTARKEEEGWVLTPYHYPYSDEIVARWFENEDGWSLEKPSDVYKDKEGDYWMDTGDGWRWYTIKNGELDYKSIHTYSFEVVDRNYSLEKLNDRDALRVRRIIREGVK